MNVSDLMNIENKSSRFDVESIKSKVINGKVSGYKIHKLSKDIKLLDSKLQESLDKMYDSYFNNHVIKTYQELNSSIIDSFTKQILKKYIVFTEKKFMLNKKEIKDCVYLIEMEITKEEKTYIGDKICNRL